MVVSKDHFTPHSGDDDPICLEEKNYLPTFGLIVLMENVGKYSIRI